MSEQRKGVLVSPLERLSKEQVEDVHHTSIKILESIGIESFNEDAAMLFKEKGAEVEEKGKLWKIKIPESLIQEGIKRSPQKVLLGAREKSNRLVLDGKEPRVRFGTGSECNNWLETEFKTFVEKGGGEEIQAPKFNLRPGTAEDLAESAHIAEHLDNLDFFIRNVNLRDKDITTGNKDVNKYFASLNNTSKHVMAGLTSLEQLDQVVKMGEIIAGGEKEFRDNPLLSFITSIAKSPLQLVEDSTQEAMEMARRGLPNVISSAPQGGTTAPIQEGGLVAQINAELLAGITMVQMVNKGAPILYGSVPVRMRMDDLTDMYGVPEFSHYNLDTVQMARYYGIPCYSTGGIADTQGPGIEATVEKMLSQVYVAMSGGQYMHCALGLLGQNNVVSPEQMILDDSQIEMVKYLLAEPHLDTGSAMETIDKVMQTPYKLFTRYARKEIRSGRVYKGYPFANREAQDRALHLAHQKRKEILDSDRNSLPREVQNQISEQIEGILPRLFDEK